MAKTYYVYVVEEVLTEKKYVGVSSRPPNRLVLSRLFENTIRKLSLGASWAMGEAIGEYHVKDLYDMFTISEHWHGDDKEAALAVAKTLKEKLMSYCPDGFNSRQGHGKHRPLSEDARRKIGEGVRRVFATKTPEQKAEIARKRALTYARKYGFTIGDESF